jgi:alpha-beta hydrolase superfamily lysophospholipase
MSTSYAKTGYGRARIYSVESGVEHAPKVMVIPGFAGTVLPMKPVVDALARRGMDAMTFSQPRHAGKGAGRSLDPIARQGVIVQQVAESHYPDEKIDAVAHSMGAGAVLKAARSDPERFRSIAVFQPLGLLGDQTIREFLGLSRTKQARGWRQARQGQTADMTDIDGEYFGRADTETARHFTRRYLLSRVANQLLIAKQLPVAYREAAAAGLYTLGEDAAAVIGQGIPVTAFLAYSDEYFDYDRSDARGDVGVRVATIYDRQAGHDTFWMQPERTAMIAGQLIIPEYPRQITFG